MHTSPDITELSVRALHRLDASNSRLRHSIVEACFYNLRVLSQELPGRADGRQLRENLEESLGNVAKARELIERHFAYPVTSEQTVGELFPEKRRRIGEALERIESLAGAGIPAQENPEGREEFSRQMVEAVDEVLGQIDTIEEEISAAKVPLREVLEEVVGIERDRCGRDGVQIALEDHTGTQPACFARREALVNALGELIDNARRHAFGKQPDGERRITVGLEEEERTRDAVISVHDTGRGMSAERLEMVGMAGASTSGGGDGIGMVRRIVEGEHLGVVRFESVPGEGTCVRVRLPRRAEPELGAEGDSPESTTEAPGGAGRWWRALSAAAVVILMASIGVAGAWYLTRGGAGDSSAILVARDGSGQYESLQAAVEGAQPGATIRVGPGEYDGRLVLEKPLRIVGDSRQNPVIRARTGPALLSTASGAVVENLRLVLDAQIKSAAVYVEGGDLTLAGCTVSSRGLAAVEVARGEPTVRNCVIGPSRRSGIFIYGGAGGSFEDLRIRDCGGSGMAVSEEADPTVRRVTITRCEKGGVNVYSGGRGQFEELEAVRCAVAGFISSTGADPTVGRSRFHEGPDDGILVADGGGGTFGRNEVHGNSGSGIVLADGSAARVTHNQVADNGEKALWIQEGAGGVVENNTTGGGDK